MKFLTHFPKWFWSNLKTDRVFLVQHLALLANMVGVWIPGKGWLGLICQGYCALVIFVCLFIESRRLKKWRREMKQGMEQLEFFHTEFERALKEHEAAAAVWDHAKARETREQLKLAAWRYTMEAERTFPGSAKRIRENWRKAFEG